VRVTSNQQPLKLILTLSLPLEHAVVSIQLNIVVCPYLEKCIRDSVIAPFSLLSVVVVVVPAPAFHSRPTHMRRRLIHHVWSTMKLRKSAFAHIKCKPTNYLPAQTLRHSLSNYVLQFLLYFNLTSLYT